MRSLRIAVVGAGVAGCAAALLLAREGHRIDLLEQTPRVGPAGAGILLQPSGQRILAMLHLLEPLRSRSEPIAVLTARTHRGRLLSSLRYADLVPGSCALGVHRADLFDLLHCACVDAGVCIRLGEVVDRALDRGDQRELRSPVGTSLGGYDLIIAADGSRSRLRQTSGIAHFTMEYAPAALWAVGHDPSIRGELLQFTHGTRELCGLLPMGQGRCSFFWGINREEAGESVERWFAKPFDEWKQRVQQLAPLSAPLLASLRGWSDLMFASYRVTVMPTSIAERLVFIGDAAHAGGPHLGQGANLALLDAACLCDCIRTARTITEALETYDARRRWSNVFYTAATAMLMPTFQSRIPGIGFARDLALPRLQQIGWIRRLMLRTLAG